MKNQKVLVTGATGFLGIHTILQLLEQRYIVNATIRSLSKKDNIIRILKEAGISNFENLHFFQAELDSDAGWSEAAEGCDYVLHIASPFPATEPEDENELIIPARDGAIRVLKAAQRAAAKRVVLTSSFAAIGYSNLEKGHIFTEADWTDENAPVRSYLKSKTIAEKAAWNFIAEAGNSLELAVINPVAMFGPTIGGISSASIDTIIKGIIEGQITQSPPFTFGVVDVRDVAEMHIRAMLDPKADGQRFIAATHGFMSFYDVAELVRKMRPENAGKIAQLQPTADEFYLNVSSDKANSLLGWHPRPKEEALLASIDSCYNK